MTLEREVATYKAKLPELLAQEGKWVLIHEEDMIGTWDTEEEALREGYERFLMEAFLVHQIQAHKEPITFYRTLVCHALPDQHVHRD